MIAINRSVLSSCAPTHYTWRVPATAKPPLRRDAQRNRDRILAATRAAFQERGLEVGVDEIARRAGVGMGTLYRHFPTKDALIDAIVDARFAELTAAAEHALLADDAWEGFAGFLSPPSTSSAPTAASRTRSPRAAATRSASRRRGASSTT
jgi:AcrR family transcriptional regulator